MLNYSNRILTVALVLFVLLKTGNLVFSSDIIIIANESVKQNSLKKSDLRDIFLGDKSTWADGKKINFVVIRKGEAHASFLEMYIKKTPKNFARYWKRQILTGKAVMPVLVQGETESIAYVKKTEGAIGYVSTSSDISGLKKLDIN